MHRVHSSLDTRLDEKDRNSRLNPPIVSMRNDTRILQIQSEFNPLFWERVNFY